MRGGICSASSICGPISALFRASWRSRLGGILFIYRIIHSPFGQVLKAIARTEPRGDLRFGYRTNRYKLAVLSCVGRFAGIGGRDQGALVFSARIADPTSTGPCSGEGGAI